MRNRLCIGLLIASCVIAEAAEPKVPSQPCASAGSVASESASVDSRAGVYSPPKQIDQAFRIVQVDPEYQRLIDHLAHFGKPTTLSAIAPIVDGVTINGPTSVFVESEQRITRFYEWNDAKVMLTNWAFQRDGAHLCFSADAFNSRVFERPAILALAVSLPRTEKCIWKITWLSGSEQRQFELYVEDTFESGQPRFHAATILKIAEALTPTS